MSDAADSGADGPYGLLGALELPATPPEFRPHVRQAIILPFDLLRQCGGLGGCYGSVHAALVMMLEAKRLNAHLHCDAGEDEDFLHSEDCQSLAGAVTAMADLSLARFVEHLDSEGYLYPHHVNGERIDGHPWEAYDRLHWVDRGTLTLLERVSVESGMY